MHDAFPQNVVVVLPHLLRCSPKMPAPIDVDVKDINSLLFSIKGML
jgi:hypothetical protein